uniref:Protein YIF1 n=1 Tax=Setaria digitata TaxID=48799 RepID=A0A915PXR2_9BILA
MTDPSWGWTDDNNRNASYSTDQMWQQSNELWNNQGGTYSGQSTTAIPSNRVYNEYYDQQTTNFGVPSQQMIPDYYSQMNQKQSFGIGSQNSYDVGSLPSFTEQFMSDPMLNAAKQIGGQFASEQKERLTKYLSAFQLKYYFAVNNAYVGKKLALLLFPFFHRDWVVRYDSSDSPVPPRSDVNAPDLYIPLMAYVTYILVSGFVLGTQKRFTPEQLGIITTNALAYLVFENLIIVITRMNVCLLAFVLGGKAFYYWVLVYMSFAVVFFLLRTVKTFLLDVQNTYSEYGGKKRKIYLMLFIAFTQPFLMWWLTSSVTNYTPGKMDLAQLALSGMGLSGAASKGQVPLMPNGEVDYEALLKMP